MADQNQTPSGLAALIKKDAPATPVTPESGSATSGHVVATQEAGPAAPNVATDVPVADGTLGVETPTGPVSTDGGSVDLPYNALQTQETVPVNTAAPPDLTGAMIPTNTPVDHTAKAIDPYAAASSPVFEAEGVEEQKDYTYRHKTIRNFSIGRWEFQNHILVCHGDKENAAFLALLGSTPESERSQIVRWNPEVLQELERPVDYTSGVVRGAQSTMSIRDAKTNPGLPERPSGFDSLLRGRSTP